jgi:formate hydrogenlyase subunit 3/multisubunit Na+/H+ antiporter MnhD subunit
MNQNKIPHTNTALILGILSYIGCCCLTGFSGLILSGVGLYFVKKGEETFAQNPEAYDNYKELKTAKIVVIVALALSFISAALYLIFRAMGIDEQAVQTLMEEMQNIQ